jgi:type II secretory pathway pseudopilin PulG
MSRKLLSSEKGFTLIAVLFIVMIMGIMLGMMGETWSMIMRRDREEELLFRGKQIKDAIKRYNDPENKGPNATSPSMPLGDLRSLYEGDPRYLERRRYLRKNYLDPITGKEWQVIKDPIKGITGVVSSSEQEPLKQANFSEEFKDFEKKDKYNKWQFVNRPPQVAGQANRPAVSGLPGGGTTGTGSAGGGTTGGSFPGGATMGSGSIGGKPSGQAGGQR